MTKAKKEVSPEAGGMGSGKNVTPIKKPCTFSLNKFKCTRAASTAGLDNLVDRFAHHKVGEAKDFFRSDADEENFWSPEFCFVFVPIKGMKKDTLHLIEEDLALEYLAER